MNEFERVRLHPHWHGLVAVYGDFSTLYSWKILHLQTLKSVRLLNRIRSPLKPLKEKFSAISRKRILGSFLQ